jgi:hypothetical protein
MTKKLRYSDILGPYFYHIGLTDDDKDMVDTYFTGAAHHLARLKEAVTKEHRYFHLRKHRAHLRNMMMIVYTKGDFSNAIDESNRDLDRRDTWNPDFCIMPDPLMFKKMLPNWAYKVGEEHCADHYLLQNEIEELSYESKKIS